jgi:hypothetical protein
MFAGHPRASDDGMLRFRRIEIIFGATIRPASFPEEGYAVTTTILDYEGDFPRKAGGGNAGRSVSPEILAYGEAVKSSFQNDGKKKAVPVPATGDAEKDEASLKRVLNQLRSAAGRVGLGVRTAVTGEGDERKVIFYGATRRTRKPKEGPESENTPDAPEAAEPTPATPEPENTPDSTPPPPAPSGNPRARRGRI